MLASRSKYFKSLLFSFLLSKESCDAVCRLKSIKLCNFLPHLHNRIIDDRGAFKLYLNYLKYFSNLDVQLFNIKWNVVFINFIEKNSIKIDNRLSFIWKIEIMLSRIVNDKVITDETKFLINIQTQQKIKSINSKTQINIQVQWPLKNSTNKKY